MKVKELINTEIILELKDDMTESDLDLEMADLTIHTIGESNDIKDRIKNNATHRNDKTEGNLETLEYSFEVGV